MFSSFELVTMDFGHECRCVFVEDCDLICDNSDMIIECDDYITIHEIQQSICDNSIVITVLLSEM